MTSPGLEVAYDWRARSRRWVKRWFPLDVEEPREHIPPGWADPIIYSWGSTGLFGKMVRDAIANARRDKRMDDVALYHAMLDQFADFRAGR